MYTVLSDGDGKYRLEDAAGMQVSWVSGRAIGFRGFADEEAARAAALDGWEALEHTLRREYGGWMHYEPRRDRLRTVHDGAYEWFYDGSIAIARLLRPLELQGHETFGIQFVLPSYATDGAVLTAAHNVAQVVARHRDRPAEPRASVTKAMRARLRLSGHRPVPSGNDAA
jgi:hypothetical protein